MGDMAARPKRGEPALRCDARGSAAEVVGTLVSGGRVVGLTYGQFGVLDILRHVLDETGPADVDVATWRLGAKEARDVARLRDDVGSIRRVRLLLGSGLAAARAGGDESWVGELATLFGPDEVRIATVHAKWFTVRNDRWDVCVRSSMNVNRNMRWEQFDLDDDAGVCDVFGDAMDAVFAGAAHSWTVSDREARDVDVHAFGPLPQGKRQRSRSLAVPRGLFAERDMDAAPAPRAEHERLEGVGAESVDLPRAGVAHGGAGGYLAELARRLNGGVSGVSWHDGPAARKRQH